MLTCSWLGGPSAGAEAVKRLQLGRWGGRGALIVIRGQLLSLGVLATGLLPLPALRAPCDQQRPEPAAMGGPGTSLGWTLHLGRV